MKRLVTFFFPAGKHTFVLFPYNKEQDNSSGSGNIAVHLKGATVRSWLRWGCVQSHRYNAPLPSAY